MGQTRLPEPAPRRARTKDRIRRTNQANATGMCVFHSIGSLSNALTGRDQAVCLTYGSCSISSALIGAFGDRLGIRRAMSRSISFIQSEIIYKASLMAKNGFHLHTIEFEITLKTFSIRQLRRASRRHRSPRQPMFQRRKCLAAVIQWVMAGRTDRSQPGRARDPPRRHTSILAHGIAIRICPASQGERRRNRPGRSRIALRRTRSP
jgi:hypothetical protein